MKHCHHCNLSFPDNYRFCGSCGKGLSNAKACPTCGDIIEAKWDFCTSCGQTASDKVQRSPVPQRTDSTPDVVAEQPPIILVNKTETAPSQTETHAWYEAPELLSGIEEITAPSMRVSHVITPEKGSHESSARGFSFRQSTGNGGQTGKQPPTLSMLSAYGQEVELARPAQPTYPIFVGAGLVILLMTIGFGVWYVFAHRAAAAMQNGLTSSQTQVGNDLSLASGGGNRSESPKAGREEDWKRLNEKRKTALPAEQPNVIAALDEAERKYPDDYRFPYERAKLSIKGVTSHDEAFAALTDAAERAIDNGQSEAMLRDLWADKDGDFWKLARGHHEWHGLIEALETKDKARLKKH